MDVKNLFKNQFILKVGWSSTTFVLQEGSQMFVLLKEFTFFIFASFIFFILASGDFFFS